ncbi:MAG: hypothetical protein KDE06_09035 [Rhodobacteraceae bacterium]|nr:hypothetical protein [Paracoccaceae bacterium]MCB2151282.1 hypothetical protein [Paracoccaceae bacterium]MCB2158319.1 hypothetical protein [Paracoccaceae bacterium]HRX73685.1 hypothetical protein [Hyphomonas sp.]
MLPPPLPSGTIRQTDIAPLVASYRLTYQPVVARVRRTSQGGGFGDQARIPFTWTVYFMVDGVWVSLESARGLRREWGSLDKLEAWLRGQGFDVFWVRNDIDPVGQAEADLE